MSKKYFHIWIDEDLHAEFKGKVGREKTSMSAVAERMIKQYLKEEDEMETENKIHWREFFRKNLEFFNRQIATISNGNEHDLISEKEFDGMAEISAENGVISCTIVDTVFRYNTINNRGWIRIVLGDERDNRESSPCKMELN